MKILVFASLTVPATANYLICSLREAGHELFVCSDVSNSLASLKVRGAVDSIEICTSHGLTPDLLLFIEGGTMRIFPTGLERMTCLTVWYGIDTHMDYDKHLRIGRLFDVTFIAQKEFVDRLQQDGLKQVYWLPLAFAPELHPRQALDRLHDIAYVGSSNAVMHPVRHAMLAALKIEFPSSSFGLATPIEMGRIYASSKLVFNRSVNNDVNMRYFEAAGSGAVLLTDRSINNGLETLFEEGVHFVVYQDEVSLLTAARALIADSDKCADMGRAARQRVLERHTYAHRVQEMLALQAGKEKRANPTPEDYFAVYLKLDLLGAALQSVGQSINASTGGRYRQVLGRILAGLLYALSGVLIWIERFRVR
jgi:hypothetical protein